MLTWGDHSEGPPSSPFPNPPSYTSSFTLSSLQHATLQTARSLRAEARASELHPRRGEAAARLREGACFTCCPVSQCFWLARQDHLEHCRKEETEVPGLAVAWLSPAACSRHHQSPNQGPKLCPQDRADALYWQNGTLDRLTFVP